MKTYFKNLLAVLLLFAVSSSITFAQSDPLAGKVFRIKAVSQKANGRCLDADAGTLGKNGTKIQLWDCHSGGGPNQDWKFE